MPTLRKSQGPLGHPADCLLSLLHLGFLLLDTSPGGLYLDIKVLSILRAFIRIFEEPLLCYNQKANRTKQNKTRWIVSHLYVFCTYNHSMMERKQKDRLVWAFLFRCFACLINLDGQFPTPEAL